MSFIAGCGCGCTAETCCYGSGSCAGAVVAGSGLLLGLLGLHGARSGRGRNGSSGVAGLTGSGNLLSGADILVCRGLGGTGSLVSRGLTGLLERVQIDSIHSGK